MKPDFDYDLLQISTIPKKLTHLLHPMSDRARCDPRADVEVDGTRCDPTNTRLGESSNGVIWRRPTTTSNREFEVVRTIKQRTRFSTYLLAEGEDGHRVLRHVMLNVIETTGSAVRPFRCRKVECCVGRKGETVDLIAQLTGQVQEQA